MDKKYSLKDYFNKIILLGFDNKITKFFNYILVLLIASLFEAIIVFYIYLIVFTLSLDGRDKNGLMFKIINFIDIHKPFFDTTQFLLFLFVFLLVISGFVRIAYEKYSIRIAFETKVKLSQKYTIRCLREHIFLKLIIL